MRLSTKSRYAITAMLDLALNGRESAVRLADISENQNISLSYLEQLFACLRTKKLVRGVRGPGGGYFLARDAREISIADIVCAVDEWVDYRRSPAYLRKAGDAAHSSPRSIWDDLSDQLFDFLDGITLASLLRSEEHGDSIFVGGLAEASMRAFEDRAA